MIVTIDARRVDAALAADATLQILLDQVRAAHVPDRLIVSVAVNGRPLSDEELQDDLALPVAADAQIDLETGDRGALICAALRGLADEFAAAADRHVAIAERLSAGDAAAAVRDVGELIGLWQTCCRVLDQCSALLGKHLAERMHDNRPVYGWFEDVVGKLSEVRAALEARDTVLLADLVRYELPPFCQTWQAVLNDLADQVAAHPTAV